MEGFRLKLDESFSLEKIAEAIDCAIVEAALQVCIKARKLSSSHNFELRHSKSKSKIDKEKFYQVINQDDTPTNISSYCFMIEAFDDEYKSIEIGLQRDFDRYGTLIDRIINILICNGDRGEPGDRIKCERILGVFETDLKQLKCIAESLYEVPPLTFYAIHDVTFHKVIEWVNKIHETIKKAKDINVEQIKNVYDSCVSLYTETETLCKCGMESLNRIMNNDSNIKLALEEALNEVALKNIPASISNNEDFDSMKKKNKLFNEYISTLYATNNEETAIMAVAKKYYRQCTLDELKQFKSCHEFCIVSKMTEAERKIFGLDYNKMNTVKHKLASFKNLKQKELTDKCIPIGHELYYKEGAKCSKTDVYNFMHDNCGNEKFFSLQTMNKRFNEYQKGGIAS